MQNVFGPMANLYQTQLEASRRFADALFAGTEKIDQVLLDATHRAVTEQLRFAQSMASVRDPQAAATAQSSFLSQRPDRAMEYQRELMRALVELQTELGNSMRQYLEQWNGTLADGAAAAEDTANDQAREIVNPVTSMFSFWESAMREATSMANRNLQAARDGLETAADAAQSTFTAGAQAAEEMTDTGRGKTAHRGRGNHASRAKSGGSRRAAR